MHYPAHGKERQKGAALIISILLLVVLTLIGLYLSQSGMLELRMADNAASRSIAFQRAEAARTYAENLINSQADQMSAAGGSFECTTGYYASSNAPNTSGCSQLDLSQMKWDTTDSIAIDQDQRYVIEYLGTDEVREPYLGVEVGNNTSQTMEVYVFRIVTRGSESAGGTVTLQSIFTARKSS